MLRTGKANKLLLVAYHFRPMQSVSCVRTWALYQHLKPYFSKVHVLSSSNRHLLQDPGVMPPDIPIRDANTIDYRTVFRSRKPGFAREQGKTSIVGKVARRLQSSYPTSLLFGEGGLLYLLNSKQIGRKLIRDHGITHVMSTFPPLADHHIAYHLKKQFPGLYWIADFRDLYVDPSQDNLFWRDYQRKKNVRLLSRADLVTTVSAGLAAHLRIMHDNVHVLPNGVLEDDVEPGASPEKFTMAYTGSLFQDKRRPDQLFKALADLIDNGELDRDKLQIWYAGKDGATWHAIARKYGLDSITKNHGLVSREEALQMQRRAHINVLLTYSHSELTGNMTGKLYEYLQARRPLVVCVNGPRDAEIEKVIDDTGIGQVWYPDDRSGSLQEYIRHLYDTWCETGQVPDAVDERALEPYRWEALTGALVKRMGLEVQAQSHGSVTG